MPKNPLLLPPAPLVTRAPEPDRALPPSWCVVKCEQGCDEVWTVDVDDFDPPLNIGQVEQMLTPLLLEHEQDHQGVWR